MWWVIKNNLKNIDNTYCTCYYGKRRERMRFREMDRILKADGWYEVKQVGSHHQYKHPNKLGKVTVPEHGGKDINPTVAKKILKQAGL